MEEHPIELIDYIRVIWRQKWVILATIAVAVVTAWLLSEVPDPTYRATTSLLLMPSLASELDSESLGTEMPVAAYGEMATSTSVLQALQENAELDLSWSLETLRARMTVTADALPNDGDVDSLRVVLLKLSITGPLPNNLEAIAQAWIDAFQSVYGSTFQDRASRSYDYILANLQQTNEDIARVTSERMRLLADHPITLLEARRSSLSSRLKSAMDELQTIAMESETLAGYTRSSEWPSREARTDLTLLADVSPYTMGGALVLGLTADEFSALLTARDETLQRQIATLTEELTALQLEIDTASADLSSLDQELGLLQSTSTFLSSKLQDARLALAETQDPIRVIDVPSVSRSPIAPKKATNMGVAGILGLLLGTVFAFFIDYLRRVHDREHPREARASAKAKQSTPGDPGDNAEDATKSPPFEQSV